jgi:2-dehydropantoate 2-reductase
MIAAVAGPGAMGCLLASYLAGRCESVWLLDRDRARAARLAADGIRIDSPAGTRTVRVRATGAAADAGTVDLLCVCVKSQDTAAAVEGALPVVGPRTVVVSFQNGLGNAERIAARVDPRRVVCAVTAQGAVRLGDGHIRHAGEGHTDVAPWRNDGEAAAVFAAGVLRECGMAVRLHREALPVLWGKLVANAAINPVTALWDVPNGEVERNPELMAVASDAAREAMQVAAALGVSLDLAGAAAHVAAVCRATAENVSSMRQDLRAGRKTEIDAINGVVVREGHRLGIPVPVNEMLLGRVRAAEAAGRGAAPPTA